MPRWSSSAAAAAMPVRRQSSETAAQLLSAAKRLENLDDDLARETYLEALAAAMYAGRLGEPGALADVAEAGARRRQPACELPRPVDFLLERHGKRIIDGVGAGSGPLRAALDHVEHAQRRVQVRRWMVLALPDRCRNRPRTNCGTTRSCSKSPLPSCGSARRRRTGRTCHQRSSTGPGCSVVAANSPRRQRLSKRRTR